MALSPEILAERAAEAEAKLQELLKRHVLFTLYTGRNGCRRVDITPPWGLDYNDPDDGVDVTMGDDAQSRVNTEGGIRMATTGFADYYCNVGSRESRLFAWEITIASLIADNWEEFWNHPERFLQRAPNPENYRWQIARH